MPEPLTLPPNLQEYLDTDPDLSQIPDIENYARIIVIGRHTMPKDERARLAWFFVERVTALANGDPVEGPDGELVEGTPEMLQHYVWLANGLGNDKTAAMFEAALPEEVRAVCQQRIAEIKEQQITIGPEEDK